MIKVRLLNGENGQLALFFFLKLEVGLDINHPVAPVSCWKKGDSKTPPD